MKARLLNVLAAAVLGACCTAAYAEDIDLFVGAAPPDANDLPNVLFVVDNTANWSTPFTTEMNALASTFQSIPPDSFRIGILFANETGGNDAGNSGGYVRAAIRPMNAANKLKYKDLILSFDRNSDKGNGGASSLMLSEAYFYFVGGTPYSGNQKAKTDFTGNTYSCGSACTPPSAVAPNNAIYALPENALSSKDGTQYRSPTGSGCGKNFIIYISNGPNQENNSRSVEATNLLTAAAAAEGITGAATMIPLSPTGSQGNPSDEWARFMKQSRLGVVTYTIDVDPPATGQGPGWSALLRSMADVSGGKYTRVSGTGNGIELAIQKALSEIQAVNTVFASVSLPVSVNTQGTYLNQVYIGMFRPDAQGDPRWVGNLKQFKFGFVSGLLRLLDADDQPSINNLTGFITECARSFWTPSVVDTYWELQPDGKCVTPAASPTPYSHSNFPDGNVVEKGAQAYKLRGATTRTMKTCSPTFASCTTLTDFSTTNSAITQALLGATSSAERDLMINWARGFNVNPANNELNKGTSAMRPSVHGDTVHSRPVALNFGSDDAANQRVVVFYGGNDGVFRAINGNRSADIGSVPAGSELWSFMPPEFYGRIKRQYDNAPTIRFPGQTDGLPKDYGMDGSVAALDFNASTAWIYATMRRGGRAFYAFEVNKTDPTQVSLKWKRGCDNATTPNCTTGLTGIGQTWSTPKLVKAAGYGSGSSPLVVMGGGYATCEDAEPHTCANDSSARGSKVFVLDADTGALLKTLNTDRSVIADVFIVPDSAGLAQHAYVVDLGGNVYRVNIGNLAPGSWTITKIASLGCDTVTTCTTNRKFMFAPDVVKSGNEYLLLLGAGDREKPLRTSTNATNYFFMLKDNPSDATWYTSEAGNCGGNNLLCLNSLLPIAGTTTPTPEQLATKKGWYLALNSREQVVTTAITIFGTVTFSSHEPSNVLGTCNNNLGTTRLYNISLFDASGAKNPTQRFEVLPPVGLPPSAVAGLVTLDNGQTVPFCIGCSVESPLEGGQPTLPASANPQRPKSRVYWFIEK